MKSLLMWAYGRGVLSFEMTERLASRLRRFRWFREG